MSPIMKIPLLVLFGGLTVQLVATGILDHRSRHSLDLAVDAGSPCHQEGDLYVCQTGARSFPDATNIVNAEVVDGGGANIATGLAAFMSETGCGSRPTRIAWRDGRQLLAIDRDEAEGGQVAVTFRPAEWCRLVRDGIRCDLGTK